MVSGAFAWFLTALLLGLASAEQQLQHSSVLVLGFLAGYEPHVTWKIVNGFFGSLRRSGFEGHQVLLHDGGCEQDEFWAMYRLRCFNIRQLEYTFSGSLASAQKSPWMRFFYWQQYLQIYAPQEVSHALVADTRDVYFQRDLFRHLQGGVGSLVFFAEDTRVLTGENLVFVDSCVECLAGRKLQNLPASAVAGGSSCWKFASLPMLNVGTIFGTTTALIGFCEELMRKMGDSGFACWDNFIFAEMVWLGSMFQNSSVFFSEQGAICTMGFAHVNRSTGSQNYKLFMTASTRSKAWNQTILLGTSSES